jgi:hypothetical protein
MKYLYRDTKLICWKPVKKIVAERRFEPGFPEYEAVITTTRRHSMKSFNFLNSLHKN